MIYTHIKKSFWDWLLIWLVWDHTKGSQFQSGVSLLRTVTFLIKETYWYLILSASVCLKSFYFSIFEHCFTVYRFWGMRFFFPFQHLKQTSLARLVSDETAAVVLTFFSVCKAASPQWPLSAVSASSQLSRVIAHIPPLNPEPAWSTAAQLDPHPLLLEHLLLPWLSGLRLPHSGSF